MDFPQLREIVRESRPMAIVHAASSVFVNECEKDSERTKIFDLHVKLTDELTKLARECGARLVYISTESVYDGKNPGLYRETDTTHPLNYYALTKLQGEEPVLAYERGVVFRTNILGWRTDGRPSFLEWVLDGLKKGEKRTMLTDVTFSPISTYQLAEDVIGAIERELSGLFHAGGATSVSKHDVATMLADRLELDKSTLVPVTMDQISMGAPRPKNTALDSTKLAKVLGKPRPTIQETIERFIQKN